MQLFHEVGRRIARRDVKHFGGRIEAVSRPHRAAGSRTAGRNAQPRLRGGAGFGTVSNCQIFLPVAASSAKTWPVTANLSLPALPMKTIPFQAMGAIETCFGDRRCAPANPNARSWRRKRKPNRCANRELRAR